MTFQISWIGSSPITVPICSKKEKLPPGGNSGRKNCATGLHIQVVFLFLLRIRLLFR
jgi:hypothetical protein